MLANIISNILYFFGGCHSEGTIKQIHILKYFFISSKRIEKSLFKKHLSNYTKAVAEQIVK